MQQLLLPRPLNVSNYLRAILLLAPSYWALWVFWIFLSGSEIGFLQLSEVLDFIDIKKGGSAQGTVARATAAASAAPLGFRLLMSHPTRQILTRPKIELSSKLIAN